MLFVLFFYRPAVRHFASCEQFNALRKEKKVFFTYVNGENADGKGDELKVKF